MNKKDELQRIDLPRCQWLMAIPDYRCIEPAVVKWGWGHKGETLLCSYHDAMTQKLSGWDIKRRVVLPRCTLCGEPAVASWLICGGGPNERACVCEKHDVINDEFVPSKETEELYNLIMYGPGGSPKPIVSGKSGIIEANGVADAVIGAWGVAKEEAKNPFSNIKIATNWTQTEAKDFVLAAKFTKPTDEQGLLNEKRWATLRISESIFAIWFEHGFKEANVTPVLKDMKILSAAYRQDDRVVELVIESPSLEPIGSNGLIPIFNPIFSPTPVNNVSGPCIRKIEAPVEEPMPVVTNRMQIVEREA